MILALFGTNPYPFERLVGFLEQLAQDRKYEIVVQTGVSRAPRGCRSFDYASYSDIQGMILRSDFVVAQGGYGSCLDTLALGRPLVLVPRRRDFGESLDDQFELSRHLAGIGRAHCVQTYPELCAAIEYVTSESVTSPDNDGRPLGKAVAQAILAHLEKR